MLEDKVHVEFTSSFIADDKQEAEELLDELFNAVEGIVCPADLGRKQTCTNCNGSLVNPPLDEDESPYEDADSEYMPGKPCWVCAATLHPGFEIPCRRDHTESSRMNTDAAWVSSSDRALLKFCEKVLTLWEQDPELAKAELIKERDTIHEFFEYSPES